MKIAVLSALVSLAAAHGVPRDAQPTELLVDEKVVVIADTDKYTLAVQVEEDILLLNSVAYFIYEADTYYLRSDVKDMCLSVEEEDGEYVPVLEKCKPKSSRHWKLIDGSKWLNEKVCQCLVVDEHDNLVFGDCADAPKCQLKDTTVEIVVATCQSVAPAAPATPATPVTDLCYAGYVCPPGFYCQDSKCWSYYQCYTHKDCKYGQVCSKSGVCVYPKPTCAVDSDCPDGYVCNVKYGQCVKAPKTCPEGTHWVDGWCVPNAKPECGRGLPLCPSGQHCDNGICVTDTEQPCGRAEDCPNTDYICSGNRCVKACPLAGCKKCERGVCLDTPVSNTCLKCKTACDGAGNCGDVCNTELGINKCIAGSACNGQGGCTCKAGCVTCDTTTGKCMDIVP